MTREKFSRNERKMTCELVVFSTRMAKKNGGYCYPFSLYGSGVNNLVYISPLSLPLSYILCPLLLLLLLLLLS